MEREREKAAEKKSVLLLQINSLAFLPSHSNARALSSSTFCASAFGFVSELFIGLFATSLSLGEFSHGAREEWLKAQKRFIFK